MYFIKKHAREDGYAEGYRVAVAEKEQAAEKEKMENARKMKTKNIPDDVIAECTGLFLEQVREL